MLMPRMGMVVVVVVEYRGHMKGKEGGYGEVGGANIDTIYLVHGISAMR
jgi:hypothetical protein